MPSFTRIVSAVACLAAAANALPSNFVVARQHETDCSKPGESFYTCGEHRGCFKTDPCTGPTLPTTEDEEESTTTEELKCPAGDDYAEAKPVAMYQIYPGESSKKAGTVDGIRLESQNNGSTVETIAVFEGLPSEAAACTFSWYQGEPLDRIFIGKGPNQLADVFQMDGFPEDGEDITYSSVESFVPDETNGAADFTNWDPLEDSQHTAGSLECSGKIYVKLSLRDTDGDNKMFLGQDDNNGARVRYTC